MCWRCERITDSSLSSRSYWLHTLSISWLKRLEDLWTIKKKKPIISSVWPLFILVHCPLAYYAPMIHHTFWPGLWPAPPGAKPSGSVLLLGPWVPGFSTPPAAVWTPLMHNGHCPATGEKTFIIFIAIAICPESQITVLEKRYFAFMGLVQLKLFKWIQSFWGVWLVCTTSHQLNYTNHNLWGYYWPYPFVTGPVL